MRYGILVVSDIHAGSCVGLCTSTVQLEDGGWYEPSLPQRFLLDAYKSCLDEADDILGTCDYKLFINNGDNVDGNHHGSTQLLSPNPAVHVGIAIDLMRMAAGIGFDAAVFTKGTAAHVGQGGARDEAVARTMLDDGLPVQRDPLTGKSAWYYWEGELGGVRIDAAHHGRVGTRPWTRPNTALNYARQLADERFDRGDPPLHIAIRSHYHQWLDTHWMQPVRMIQTASFQLPTEFIHRIAAGSLPDVGMCVITIDDSEKRIQDRVRVHPILRRAARGKAWTPVQ